MSNRLLFGTVVGMLLLCGVAGAAGAVGVDSETNSEAAMATATIQDGDVSVSEISIDRTTAAPGETVEIEGIVENTGTETIDVDITFEVDGERVETETVSIHPEFPVLATFEWTAEEPGTYQLSINGVEASEELVVEEEDNDQTENGVDEDQFSVLEVSIADPEIEIGTSTEVIADIGNDGDEDGDYEVTLEKDGEAIETQTVEEIQAQLDVGAQAFFDIEPEETGTYTISVNGVEAEQELVVTSGEEDSGLFSFLGFLPLGLLRLVGLFVVLPLLLVYLALKALAIYLGY